MAQRPGLKRAVAGEKNKASDYNDNFDLMMDFVEDSAEEQHDELVNVLSIYQNIITLPTSGNVNLLTNTINAITPTGAVTFVLPNITGDNAAKYNQILVMLKETANNNIDLGTTNPLKETIPNVDPIGRYDIIYEYDNIDSVWRVGAIRKI